jgi:dienelactone hydrolase
MHAGSHPPPHLRPARVNTRNAWARGSARAREEGLGIFVWRAGAAGGTAQVFDYPGSGHLFADPSKTDEYQPAEAQLLWSRVTEFLEQVATHTHQSGRIA